MVLAVLMDLVQLGTATLWFDEISTAQWIAAPWQDMIGAVLSDNHVPLYPILLKLWSGSFGTSNFALRLPGIPCHVVIVWCVAYLATVGTTERAGRFAAFFAALAPFLLHHSQEARMYPLMGALAAISLVIVARFLTRRIPSLGAGYVLTCVAMLATHYYAMFAVGAELLVVLILRPAPLRRYLPAVIAVALACAAFAASALLVARHEAGSSYDLGYLALLGLGWSLVGGYTFLPDSMTLHGGGWRAAVEFLPVAVPAAVAVIYLIWRGSHRADSRVVSLWGLVVAVSLIGPYAISVAIPTIGINPRYTVCAAPALFAWLGSALADPLPLRDGLARYVAVAVILACMVAGDARELSEPGRTREDVASAGHWLDENVATTDPILVTSNEMGMLARYHWPSRALIDYPKRSVVIRANDADSIATNLPVAPQHGRWIYVVGRAWLSDPDGAYVQALRRRYATCPGFEARGISILCLQERH